MNSTATKVSIGLSTALGLSASVASYIGAAVSVAQGDHSQQTVALLASGTVTAIGVIASRAHQAVAHIRNEYLHHEHLRRDVERFEPVVDQLAPAVDPTLAALLGHGAQVAGQLTVSLVPPEPPQTPPVA